MPSCSLRVARWVLGTSPRMTPLEVHPTPNPSPSRGGGFLCVERGACRAGQGSSGASCRWSPFHSGSGSSAIRLRSAGARLRRGRRFSRQDMEKIIARASQSSASASPVAVGTVGHAHIAPIATTPSPLWGGVGGGGPTGPAYRAGALNKARAMSYDATTSSNLWSNVDLTTQSDFTA